jgi:hypothetical protein
MHLVGANKGASESRVIIATLPQNFDSNVLLPDLSVVETWKTPSSWLGNGKPLRHCLFSPRESEHGHKAKPRCCYDDSWLEIEAGMPQIPQFLRLQKVPEIQVLFVAQVHELIVTRHVHMANAASSLVLSPVQEHQSQSDQDGERQHDHDRHLSWDVLRSIRCLKCLWTDDVAYAQSAKRVR